MLLSTAPMTRLYVPWLFGAGVPVGWPVVELIVMPGIPLEMTVYVSGAVQFEVVKAVPVYITPTCPLG